VALPQETEQEYSVTEEGYSEGAKLYTGTATKTVEIARGSSCDRFTRNNQLYKVSANYCLTETIPRLQSIWEILYTT
jgi:hypothetical protein